MVVPTAGQTATARDPLFGIDHVGYATGTTAGDRYVRAAAAGARWNRWALYWTDVERSAGSYDWSGPDAVVAADRANGFESDAILLGTPSFYNSAVGTQEVGDVPRVEDKSAAFAFLRGQPYRRASAATTPPRNLYQPTFADGTDTPGVGKAINPNNPWARFVSLAVARYSARVHTWEIWNEPDFSAFWTGSVADYARLLKVASLTIRSVDPGAQVLVGGMMYWEWANSRGVEHAWLRAFLDELARDPSAPSNGYYFDVIPWHWYSRPSDAYDKVASARSILQSRGVTGKRMWVNESNAPACGEPPLNVSCSDPNYKGSATVSEQAAYVIQYYAYALAAQVEHAFVFQYADDGVGEAFGLFRNDGTARPAYTAYTTAVNELAGATGATRQTAGSVERIAVTMPTGRVTVLWARGPSAETGVVQAATSTARLVEVDGTTSTVAASGGQYRIPLAPATDNRSFANTTTDYIIGGPPRMLVERFSNAVPTPPPGWMRARMPLIGQRTSSI